MRLIASLLVAGSLIVAAGSAKAQQPVRPQGSLSLAPGTRVRVTGGNLVGPLVASYLEMRGDTLVLIEENAGRAIWQLPIDQVTLLERTTGQSGSYKPYVARGALFGAGGGIAGGLLFAMTFSPSDSSKRFNRPLTMLVGGVLGAGIGAIVGSRMSTERWVAVQLPRRLSILPARNGGVRVSLVF